LAVASSLQPGATYQPRSNEFGISGPVGLGLEFPWANLRPLFHLVRVSVAKLIQNWLSRAENLVRPPGIERLAEHTDDVVRILRSLRDGLALQDETSGILDVELCTFNEVAEVRFQEC
jgi:hypothetical protein